MTGGQYVTANGVKTYYEVHGEGEPLLLLHGGAVPAIESFALQTPELAKHFKVILPERRGHGRTADVDGPITYDLMAQDTIAFMEALAIKSAHLVGWSDGANVGMLVAISRPDLVKKLVSISGNFHVDGLTQQFKTFVERVTPDPLLSRGVVQGNQPGWPRALTGGVREDQAHVAQRAADLASGPRPDRGADSRHVR